MSNAGVPVQAYIVQFTVLHQGHDEQPVLSQNSMNALERQSYNSRVLFMEVTKTG